MTGQFDRGTAPARTLAGLGLDPFTRAGTSGQPVAGAAQNPLEFLRAAMRTPRFNRIVRCHNEQFETLVALQAFEFKDGHFQFPLIDYLTTKCREY